MARDSALKSSLREAPWVLLLWAAALVYTIGYCYYFGPSAQPGAPLTFTFGLPTWICWGVVAPWLVCYALSSLFALGFMADADLDEPAGPIASDDHAV